MIHTTLLTAAALALSLLTAATASAQVGRRFPSERKIIPDPITNVPLTVLTDGVHADSKFYQTHPQWAADGQWILFRSSDRSADGHPQIFAVHELTGDIVQITDGTGHDLTNTHLFWKQDKLVIPRNVPWPSGLTPPSTRPADATQMQLVEIDFGKILADSAAGKPAPAASYERIAATLPPGTHGAAFGLDVDERHIYISVRGPDVGAHLPPGVTPYPKPEGARMGAGPGGLRSIDLTTGEIKVILDTPFQIGHVQSSPFVPGEIVYCWETGGKAPQRMWATNADGTNNRPLFPEIASDWITHEVIVTPDEVMFDLIGHKPELRTRPTGIAVLNLRTNAMTLLGQVDETVSGSNEFHGPGGFWHCNGSRDGRFAAGDTFTGNVWLIDRSDGQRTLLTTDHKMKPDHCHPSFHPDSTRLLIQSGHWTNGKHLQLVVVPVPESILAKAKK